MINCMLTVAAVTAIAWISYEVGKIVGYEEAQAGKHARRRQASQ